MSEAPIKKCDYCETTGKIPTFMTGETICYSCLDESPKDLRDANKIIHELKAQH